MVQGHCLTSLRSVIVSKCQNLSASTAQTAVPSTSLFVPRQTRRQTPRSYAADAVPRSKDATAGSSSNTSSWIVQGPKPKRRLVDERRRAVGGHRVFPLLIFVKPIALGAEGTSVLIGSSVTGA